MNTLALVPDPLIRVGIRRLLRQRLREEGGKSLEQRLRDHLALLREGPIAEATEAANDQHYEVPAAFFERVLGRHLKYSGCYWPDGVRTLDEAEEAALAQVAQRADVGPGQRILDLGCGWGSFSLYAAERFPDAQVTAVSNSHGQRAHIEQQAARRGLHNLRVVTANVAELALPAGRFDRVVSVEMFEHMRNYDALFARVADWLADDGLLFVHIFSHARYAYRFEDRGKPGDWMARHFFTGGQMPSADLLLHFTNDVTLLERWEVNGRHYAETAEAWLRNMDAHREELRPLLRQVYGGTRQGDLMWTRWRVFFMACAELFGFDRGRQWAVTHYLFERRRARRAADPPLRVVGRSA